MCATTYNSTIPGFATTGQCYPVYPVPLGYVACRQYSCVLAVQYFLCDRNNTTFLVYHTVPTAPRQRVLLGTPLWRADVSPSGIAGGYLAQYGGYVAIRSAPLHRRAIEERWQHRRDGCVRHAVV